MSTEKQHHKWSPSKWSAFVNCLAYKSSDKSSDAAYRGTLQHSYLEAIGTNNTDEKLRLEMLLTGTEIENVMFVYGRVREAVVALGDGVEVLWEQSFVSMGKHFTPIPGHADIAIVKNDEIWIIDAKFGAVKDYDPQLIVYSLGAMQKFNKPSARYWILYGQEKKSEAGTVTREEATTFFNDMVAKLIEAEKNPATVKRSTCTWCQYCENRNTCGEFMKEIGNTVALAGVTEQVVPTAIDLETCDIDQLGKLVEALSQVEKFQDSAKDALKRRIKNGEASSVYKIQSKSGSLAITDIHGVAGTLVQLSGKSHYDVNEALLDAGKFSLSGVRSFLYGSRSEEKAVKDEFELKFADHLSRGNATESLVKLSAKEKAALLKGE